MILSTGFVCFMHLYGFMGCKFWQNLCDFISEKKMKSFFMVEKCFVWALGKRIVAQFISFSFLQNSTFTNVSFQEEGFPFLLFVGSSSNTFDHFSL